MAQKVIEAKVAFYEAHASASLAEALAMASQIDMKLARQAHATAVAEDTTAENLLSTLMCEMELESTDFEVECEVEQAVETKLCLEEEEDGITSYYARTYG